MRKRWRDGNGRAKREERGGEGKDCDRGAEVKVMSAKTAGVKGMTASKAGRVEREGREGVTSSEAEELRLGPVSSCTFSSRILHGMQIGGPLIHL